MSVLPSVIGRNGRGCVAQRVTGAVEDNANVLFRVVGHGNSEYLLTGADAPPAKPAQAL